MCGLCVKVGVMCGLCVENVVKVWENSQKQPNMWVLGRKMCLEVLLHVVKLPYTCFTCIAPICFPYIIAIL